MAGIDSDIESAKKKLINKAIRKGLYENFGQTEARELYGKYGSYSPESNKINEFERWAGTFDDRKLADAQKLKKVL